MKKLIPFLLSFLVLTGCTVEERRRDNSEAQQRTFQSLPEPTYFRDCRLDDVCFALAAQVHEGGTGFSMTSIDCKKVEKLLERCPLSDKEKYLQMKKIFEATPQ